MGWLEIIVDPKMVVEIKCIRLHWFHHIQLKQVQLLGNTTSKLLWTLFGPGDQQMNIYLQTSSYFQHN